MGFHVSLGECISSANLTTLTWDLKTGPLQTTALEAWELCGVTIVVWNRKKGLGAVKVYEIRFGSGLEFCDMLLSPNQFPFI